MRILQIGLGSMGKRRIQNLFTLGIKDVIAFDPREDRRKEVENTFRIPVVSLLDESVLSQRDAFIISTPPDSHLEYLWLAVRNKKAAFVEASVLKEGLPELIEEAEKHRVFIAPSCTFRFHPAIKTIKEIISSGKYGKVCNYMYHIGQYLPDWHPWEDIKDFYVSKKETSACREMVTFELTWMVDIFGFPKEVFAFYGKTTDLGADIDDTYSITLRFEGFLANMLVDVVARHADRSLIANLEKASIFWNWNEKAVKLFDALEKRWIHYCEPEGTAWEGYNRNIVESMYIEELNAFIRAINGIGRFPNSLREDVMVLEILEMLERTNSGARIGSKA